MKNIIYSQEIFKLIDCFIKESENGKRLQKNGKKIRKTSIKGYKTLKNALQRFCDEKHFELRIKNYSILTMKEKKAEKKYWKNFYISFTNYMYNERNCYDNYVGTLMNRLKAFFNYLLEEKDLNVGSFHKSFYSTKEEIEILTLSTEQLNFLIYNEEFENKLNDELKMIKDIFVFGCTVALRASDLLNLSYANIEYFNGKHYLKVTSQKTSTFSRILLPEYAVNIIKKRTDSVNLFPKYELSVFNEKLKKLFRLTNWNHEILKIRFKRGIPYRVLKSKETATNYKFCDVVSSHIMRRTAITTLLCLNMPETMVRKISGHAPDSRDFYRYVQLSQRYMDSESEKVFELLKNKNSIQ